MIKDSECVLFGRTIDPHVQPIRCACGWPQEPCDYVERQKKKYSTTSATTECKHGYEECHCFCLEEEVKRLQAALEEIRHVCAQAASDANK